MISGAIVEDVIVKNELSRSKWAVKCDDEKFKSKAFARW